MPLLASLVCGFIFGAGLVISGMVQTTKVLGFLDVLGIADGTWDPSLIVVMAAGLAVTGIGYGMLRSRKPILAPENQWPTPTVIDRPLLYGAALFGIGWGLVGLCPGPAIADLATISPGVIIFAVAMTVGMAAHDLWQSRVMALAERRPAGASSADG